MKYKVIILICLLACVLLGCRKAEVDTIAVQAETPAATTAVTELETEPTTEPTVPPTEETEPTYPNYFEENEIVLWEYANPKFFGTSEEEAEKLTSVGYDDVYPYYGFYAHYKTDQMLHKCAVYGFPEDRSKLFGEQINMEIESFYSEIPSIGFMIRQATTAEYVGELMYEAYCEKYASEMAMKEWLDKYKDYKIIDASVDRLVKCEKLVDRAHADGVESFCFFYDSSVFMDKNTGMIYSPESTHPQLLSFTVDCNGEEKECWAWYNFRIINKDLVQWRKIFNDPYNGRRRTLLENFYIMVPAEYDGIIAGNCEVEQPLLEEAEFYAEISGDGDQQDTEDWQVCSVYEYLEDKENYRFHFWGLLP